MITWWKNSLAPSFTSYSPRRLWRFRRCSHWRGPPPLLPSAACSVGDGVQTCSRCQRTWPRPTWSLRCGRGWAPAGWSETWGWAPSQPAFCGVERRGKRDGWRGGGSKRHQERVEKLGERWVWVSNSINTDVILTRLGRKGVYYHHLLILSYSPQKS